MARLHLLFALCVLPAIVSASFVGNPFLVNGRVYCDTCRCGFETPATKYLAGAKVKIECKNRHTSATTYSINGVTDSIGTYSILVPDDHADEDCVASLVSSPDPECAEPNKGRDRATVVLTRFNGISSDNRFANNMGFLKKEALSSCTQVLKLYEEDEV